jgi:hypothetical protein
LAITAGNLLVQAEQCGRAMRSSASGIHKHASGGGPG